MNFNFKDVKEGSTQKYLKHGINKVKVSSIELATLNTANYQGDVINVEFANEEGAINKWTIFPFQARDNAKKFKGGKEIGLKPADEQLSEYLANIKHIFTKALGSDENFNKVMSKVTDFKTMAVALKAGIKSFGAEFYLMLCDDKGYAKVKNWTGGIAAFKEEDLEWNEAKYGKKDGPKNAEKVEASAGTFDFGATVPPEKGEAEKEADDLPW